ncbi:MAG TPA: nitrilase-related carbon-nitrogen hydrolase, partial [Hanamia sp.]|nr:nitrilase-related carbon-nitrogen hydrolase [Hanamia sp.]
AEKVPDGISTQKLIRIAKKYDITILAGLVEIKNDQLFNTYICVDESGLIAKYSKIHPFISKYFSPGNEYVIFDIKGWKCGILICYDNNVVENVRATSLLGAEIIFAPHVTMCTPSSMPGRGFVDDALWQKRELDPVPLRMEFDGPKGRQWLMRWLPARAYDNGVYYVFTNPIGYDGDQLKNGNSLILDPYGDVLTEIKSFDDEIATAIITEDKLKLSGGYRYKNARRPELYRDIIGADHESKTKPVWMEK